MEQLFCVTVMHKTNVFGVDVTHYKESEQTTRMSKAKQERTNDGTYPTDDEKRIQRFKDAVNERTLDALVNVAVCWHQIEAYVSDDVHAPRGYPITHVHVLDAECWNGDERVLQVFFDDVEHHKEKYGTYHKNE